MTDPDPLSAPVGLAAAGARLWGSVTAKYELSPAEARLLEDAAREADVVDRLEAALAGAPLVVPGSTGQDVAHPLLAEVRQHRAVLARLLGALKLPADDAPAAESTSTRARRAARARWTGPRVVG